VAGPATEALSLASRVEEIDGARRWVTERIRAAGFGDDDVWALELALTEALANVIHHAYGGDPGQRIELELRVGEERAEVTIRDYGAPFDPHAYEPEPLDTPRSGGYGVHLIREVLDEVAAEPAAGGGTQLRLTKYRSPGSPPPRS
jgi:anti-sigma regulatory factor (Ser/Thr protein kinase)